MERVFVFIGALSSCFAVVAGAFAAHALEGRLPPDMLGVFEVGARYQMYHGLALISIGFSLSRWPSIMIKAGGFCLLFGTLFFSGSLYLLALTGESWLGVITPFGGALFIAGWLLFALGVIRQ